MFSLKEIIPKEKAEEKSELIDKYRRKSHKYLEHKLDIAIKAERNTAQLSCFCVFITFMIGLLTLIATACSDYANMCSKILIINETTQNGALRLAESSGAMSTIIPFGTIIVIGGIMFVIAFMWKNAKDEKLVEFWKEVIDTKFEDEE